MSIPRRVKGLPRSLPALYDAFRSIPLFGSEEKVLSGAAAIEVSGQAYKVSVTTGGTAGAEVVNLPAGSEIGQRILIELETRTNAADLVDLGVANIQRLQISGETGQNVTNLDLDAVGEFALLEWTGSAWNLLYSNGTVAAV